MPEITTSLNTDLSTLASSPLQGQRMGRNQPGNWFEAFAAAWGNALDRQASAIEQRSDLISNEGGDTPSQITQLTAESMKMSFISQSSHTSLDSVSKALETMARKS
ncbi:hypothetical protein [Sphingomonas sanxanigenens]|uniref:Type III secretion protein n=1 Tax=Sphingomonas sanxanigenens DSM 19645 = NX02 TaxID=1123269 RepID=W0AGS0_9SPHN|nr:hypothetical protein [Sphingomonas sanxanigenens]AHE54850.1 hypothetical protein NX02_15850 [Sphingomonas sanxanigenens DSM 19645 = NX02]